MQPNPQKTVHLVTFTEEILNRIFFLCSVAQWYIHNVKEGLISRVL